MHQLAVKELDVALHSVAQLYGGANDGVEHGLYIGRRATDNAKDLARGCLLLQRLGHLCVRRSQSLILSLQLREEAHVLDGDHRLRGEGLEERDLALTERARLGAANAD